MNFINGSWQEALLSSKETNDFLEQVVWKLQTKVEQLELEIENLKGAMLKDPKADMAQIVDGSVPESGVEYPF